MTSLAVPALLYAEAVQHLDSRPEEVGFFLAEWEPTPQRFAVREWRAIASDGLEVQTDYHVSLTDETSAEIIKWAWDERMCLIETHSHELPGPAEFSPSDLMGLDEWVAHLWWRLHQRPYAALVRGDGTLDGLSWVDGPGSQAALLGLEIDDGRRIAMTGATARRSVSGVRRNGS